MWSTGSITLTTRRYRPLTELDIRNEDGWKGGRESIHFPTISVQYPRDGCLVVVLRKRNDFLNNYLF